MKNRLKNYITLGILLMNIACNRDPGKTDRENGKAQEATAKNERVVNKPLSDSLKVERTIDTLGLTVATAYLQHTLKDDIEKSLIDENSRRFRMATADLNGDGKNEIFIGHTGSYFCGSGGCTIELLHSTGKKITTFSVTDYPILISATKHQGWNDLLLLNKGRYHNAVFNGNHYPSNPSVLPETGDAGYSKRIAALFDDTRNEVWHKF